MPVQREKVVRVAEKLVSRGRIDAAIREYRKVLDDQPDDATTLNRVGDLYARTDRIDEAIKLFSQIAEGYTADGFFVKAIAIYKKIIKLDPTRLEVYERLAALYHRQGLLNEALSQYQVLADYYQKHDDAASAIGIYERMALIDPEDPAPRVKLAELYGEQELLDKAMGEYRRIAELMLGHGRIEQAEQVYRRALEVTAEDLGFVTDAVLELKQAGHVAAAARLLGFAVERNPKAAGVGRMAGLAGGAARRAGGASEVAEGPPAHGDGAEVAVEEEPVADEIRALGDVLIVDESLLGDARTEVEEPEVEEAEAEEAAAPAAAPAPSEDALADSGADLVLDLDAPRDLDDSFDLGTGLDLAEEIGRAGAEIEAARVGGPEAPAAQGRSGRVEIDADFLERTAAELVPERSRQEDDLITEAEVLAKYGLADKAAERVAELLELNPQHRAGLRLRVRLLVDAGRAEEALAAAAWLRETVGEGSAAWTETVERLEKAGYTVADGRIAPPAGEIEPAEEIELAVTVEDVEAASRAEPTEAARPEAASPEAPPAAPPAEPEVDTLAAAPPPPAAAPPPAEEPATRPGRVQRMEREVESLLEEIADALVPGRRKKKSAAAAEAVSAAPGPETPTALPPEAAAPEPEAAAPPPAESPSVEPPASVEPPPAASEPTEIALPGLEAAEWLAAVESSAAAPGAAGGEVFDQEEDFFDLAAEIEEELAREGALDDDELLLEPPREQSLEEIVEGFKKGVSEALAPEDYATHLDLGIAYREMGLLDEAIGEFQIAAKAPGQLVQCCSMLGLSFLEKGLPELAVKWYHRGLAVPDLSEDDQLGLLYDLGNAHLALGEREEAYRIFVDLYGTNSNYRDVVAKLAETAPRER